MKGIFMKPSSENTPLFLLCGDMQGSVIADLWELQESSHIFVLSTHIHFSVKLSDQC